MRVDEGRGDIDYDFIEFFSLSRLIDGNPSRDEPSKRRFRSSARKKTNDDRAESAHEVIHFTGS